MVWIPRNGKVVGVLQIVQVVEMKGHWEKMAGNAMEI